MHALKGRKLAEFFFLSGMQAVHALKGRKLTKFVSFQGMQAMHALKGRKLTKFVSFQGMHDLQEIDGICFLSMHTSHESLERQKIYKLKFYKLL